MCNVKKLICAGMACLMLSPAMAFSREDDEDSSPDFNKPMTKEHAVDVAKLLLAEELRAKKLTLQQATDYTLCTNQEYANHLEQYQKTAEYQDFAVLAERMLDSGKRLSAQEKTKMDTYRERMHKSVNALQDRSEEACSKKLGLNVKRGKVFGKGFSGKLP
ncbi:MAG: hypothetical protein LBP86_05965 [Azoarcus sp.]|jgi:phospholipase/lecithinase/hemolysin|nr:hypothetical protein [Azoarcus sp.]